MATARCLRSEQTPPVASPRLDISPPLPFAAPARREEKDAQSMELKAAVQHRRGPPSLAYRACRLHPAAQPAGTHGPRRDLAVDHFSPRKGAGVSHWDMCFPGRVLSVPLTRCRLDKLCFVGIRCKMRLLGASSKSCTRLGRRHDRGAVVFALMVGAQHFSSRLNRANRFLVPCIHAALFL